MESEHASQLIPDYVLGLLSADECHRMEQHVRQCPACREAVRRERQLAIAVRQVVQAAGRPPTARLQQLRPALPRPGAPVRGRLYRELAPLTALAVLIAVVLLTQYRALGPSSPAFALTASPASTMTHTPTATLAAAPETGANATAVPATATHMALRGNPSPALLPTAGEQQQMHPPANATPMITYAR